MPFKSPLSHAEVCIALLLLRRLRRLLLLLLLLGFGGLVSFWVGELHKVREVLQVFMDDLPHNSFMDTQTPLSAASGIVPLLGLCCRGTIANNQ